MDHDLGAIVTTHRNHLELVARSISAEVQHLAVIWLGRTERMSDRVHDVVVGVAVLASELPFATGSAARAIA